MSKKHSSSEDQVNGLSSPAKMQKLNEDAGRVARMKDLLGKGGGPVKLGGGGGGGPRLILPKPPKTTPKPQPKPKPAAGAAASSEDVRSWRSTSPPVSPSSLDHHMEDVGPICLNTDSLKQFSDTFDYDLDVVERHQILDSTAQKDRAALSQSKGLQNRRLPANLVNKVPEDYSERRRCNTYSGAAKKAVGSPAKQPAKGMEDSESVDGGESIISEEERRQRNLNKLGVQQSNNPLAALGSILKRNSSGRGSWRSNSKSPKGSPSTPPKTKKKNSLDVSPSPVPARLGSEPPQSIPKSPKGFLRSLRKNSSKTKKKSFDGDDMQSETSSIVSLPIHGTVDETTEPMETTPSVTPTVTPSATPSKSADVSVPVSKTDSSSSAANTSVLSVNGGFSPSHTSSPRRVPLRDKPHGSSPIPNRKTTDSAIFKEGSFEHLFGAESNLFDSKELDALLGKKEKTPERMLEQPKNTPAGATPPSEAAPQKKDVFKSRNIPVVPKIEKKRSDVDSPRSGIKANLHRYESNSKVSKTELSDSSDPVTTTSKSPIKASLLFEEDEDDLFGPVKTDTDIKKPDEEEKVNIKKAKLFDDDDDLFSADKPSKSSPAKSSPKRETSDKQTPSIVLEEPEKAEPRKKLEEVIETTDGSPKPSKKIHDVFGTEVDEEPKASKKTYDLFGDSEEVEVEKKAKDDLFGDALFDDIPESKPKSPSKHSTLFDEDDDSSDLFSVKRREQKKDAPLFPDSESKSPSSSTSSSPKSKPKVPKAMEVDISDHPLGILDDEMDELEYKPERTEVKPAVQDDKREEAKVSAEATVDDSVTEPTPSPKSSPVKKADDSKSSDSKVAGRKGVGADPVKGKPTDKPKPGGDTAGKPSWMAELKKRKQGGTAPPTAPKKEPVEPPMPEWKKKALERKKKAEEAKSGVSSTRSSSTKPAPVSPKPGRTSPTKSPATARKSPLTDRSSPKDDASKSPRPRYKTRAEREKEAKEQEGKTNKPDKESTEVRPRYKTRAEREREAKEQEEKAKKPDTETTEERPRYKTRAEAKEKKNIEDVGPLPTYKTRRQREREAREAKEQEEKAKNLDTENTEEKSPPKKDMEDMGPIPTYKTRRQRGREAKEAKEQEEKAKKLDTEEITEEKPQPKKDMEDMGPIPTFKTRRQREREAKEAKEQEEKAKKLDTEETTEEKLQPQPKKDMEDMGPIPTYKTRRQREREAKEKEESERLQKEGESKKPKSPTKPPLTRKPSIEVTTKKKATPQSQSQEEVDEAKPTTKDKQNSKTNESEDDVFSAEDTRSSSAHSLRRTPSPIVSIDVLSTIITKPDKPDVVENGQKDKPAKIANGDNKPSVSSTSDKSSVSSERDVTEPKPYRSQSMSVSSRSPTPTSATISSDSIPGWKKQLMERKKSSSSPVHKAAPKKVEPLGPDPSSDLPQWKKDLLARKKNKPDDKDVAPRAGRSVTVSAGVSSSSRRGKEPAPTPDFMKEFQKKKQRNT